MSSPRETVRPTPLVRESLRRPIAVAMMFCLILAMGIVTYLKLPLQLLPSEGFSGRSITIVVPYPNASPRECEESIVRPVEEAIGRVPGVKQIRATAGSDAAQIRVEFHATTDIHLAQADLKEQLERTKKRFPEGADRYFLYKFDMDDALPIIFAGILIDESVEDPNRRIDELVTPRLERLDGVARVNIFGLRTREIEIEIDREAITALDIPLYELIQRMTRENRTLSCGDVEEGQRQYLVRAMGELETLEEIESFPVRPGLSLSDVADIRIVESEEESITRVNRKPAAILLANKESAANTVDVCRKLDEELALLNDDPRLAGLEFHTYFDQGKFIVESIGVLRETALIGGLLALVVLFVFMKRIAMTFTVALAIPTSILLALVILYFTGGTLNVFTMMGLTVGIGMLVDNSIVVAENIDRLRREGNPIRLSALLGPSQVSLAIVLSTATTAVVFVPMIFLGEDSNTRVMLREIGLPVIYALAASLFVALVFVPLAILLFDRRGADPNRTGLATKLAHPWFLNPAVKLYARLLPYVLRYRVEMIVFGVVPFLLSTSLAFSWVKKTADLGGDSSQVQIDLEFPTNLSLSDADEIVREFETILEKRRSELGYDFFAAQFTKRRADFTLFLEREAEVDKEDVVAELRQILPVRAGTEMRFGSEESDNREARLRVLVTGPDSEVLAEIASDVRSKLQTIDGLQDVRSDLDEEGTDEIRVGLARDLTRRYDVNPQEVLGLVSYSLRGARLPDYERGRETLEVWVRFREEDRAGGIDRLANLQLPTPDGGSVPLATVASFERARGYRAIQREDRRTVMSVNARYAEDDQSKIERQVRAALAPIVLPQGYRVIESGGFREFEERFSEVGKAMILAVVFVFLLMGILFESFVLPLSVLLAIPFSICGGLWGLVATRTPLDSVAMVGFIILAGVVVNNAIVLVDAINRIRRAGSSRTEAILEAARNRFRPIWMTALTTVLGLLPMAIREASTEGVSYLTMARAVIGGLFVATIFTLFIVPLFYTFFDDIGRIARSALTRILKSKGGAAAQAGAIS